MITWALTAAILAGTGVTLTGIERTVNKRYRHAEIILTQRLNGGKWVRIKKLRVKKDMLGLALQNLEITDGVKHKIHAMHRPDGSGVKPINHNEFNYVNNTYTFMYSQGPATDGSHDILRKYCKVTLC